MMRKLLLAPCSVALTDQRLALSVSLVELLLLRT
jgi:hypothetical protein